MIKQSISISWTRITLDWKKTRSCSLVLGSAELYHAHRTDCRQHPCFLASREGVKSDLVSAGDEVPKSGKMSIDSLPPPPLSLFMVLQSQHGLSLWCIRLHYSRWSLNKLSLLTIQHQWLRFLMRPTLRASISFANISRKWTHWIETTRPIWTVWFTSIHIHQKLQSFKRGLFPDLAKPKQCQRPMLKCQISRKLLPHTDVWSSIRQKCNLMPILDYPNHDYR